MRMEVVEQPSSTGDQIIFTYRFLSGAAGKSYGIHVARLAGIPESVVKRAHTLLQSLSSHDFKAATPVASVSTQAQPQPAHEQDPLRQFLKSVEPDELSARDALDLIYELVKTARKEGFQESDTLLPQNKRSPRKKQLESSGLQSLF